MMQADEASRDPGRNMTIHAMCSFLSIFLYRFSGPEREPLLFLSRYAAHQEHP